MSMTRMALRRAAERRRQPALRRSVLAAGDLGRDAHRLEQVDVVGDVLAGDVEGGAVARRGPDERQAEGQRPKPTA
jgi:hypothetical protein